MKKYLLLIIVEGATVMAVELCGAKLLSPLYGGSLFVWASILATTLSALAFGYYFGGVLSGKEKVNNKLFQVIMLASITIALMPFVSTYLLPYISYLHFKLAVILSAGILIFIPIALLGCTTPLLIRLNTVSAETSGLVSGKIYALSTVGGIVSTLLCGFFLIPQLGLKFTLLLFAVLLFLACILVLKIFRMNTTLVFIVELIFSMKVYSNSNHALYSRNGIMGEIEVIDLMKPSGKVRQLLINQIVQTEMNLSTKNSSLDYIKMIDTTVAAQTQTKNALILGMGGGMVANLIERKNYKVDAVEFDYRIIEAAKEYFFLSKTINCFDEDARAYINSCKKSYDLIIMDVFKAEEQPVHIITLESFNKVRELLSDSGKLIINWHGYTSLPLGAGTEILLNTLSEAKFSTNLSKSSPSEDYSNSLIIARKSVEALSATNLAINTDDLPSIELANAQANLRWRINYLRFYQGLK